MKHSRASRLTFASDDAGSAVALVAPSPERIRSFRVPPPHHESPAKEARYLLTAAAEIEHGLLVQYLYAAYSLSGSETDFPDVSDGARIGGRILAVAVEEMGHLLNVQNLLLALGDQPYLDRENYEPGAPAPEPYPFPFALEPLERAVLAKYVAAESPLPSAIEDLDLRDEVLAIIAIGKGSAQSAVNHVGVLYAQLHWLFQATDDSAAEGWPSLPDEVKRPGWHIPAADLTGLSKAATHAAAEPEFGLVDLSADPTARRFVLPVASRADALELIRRIAEQGEGLTLPQSAEDDSHFEWFLGLYRSWPDLVAAGLTVRVVPKYPNTTDPPPADLLLAAGCITYQPARLWARFMNVRYHVLLLKMALIVLEPRDDSALRARLVRSALLEMRRHLKALSMRLVSLPRRQRELDGSIRLFAGPPFEMPDAELPRETGAVVAALREAMQRSAERAVEIKALEGDDRPTPEDILLLDRIATDDESVRSLLP